MTCIYRKPNLISCKRKKLAPSKKLFQKDASVLRATEEEVLADNECSDDSDSDGWQILEEKSDTELDKALEKNASKNKLTAFNVKTILHVRYTSTSWLQNNLIGLIKRYFM